MPIMKFSFSSKSARAQKAGEWQQSDGESSSNPDHPPRVSSRTQPPSAFLNSLQRRSTVAERSMSSSGPSTNRQEHVIADNRRSMAIVGDWYNSPQTHSSVSLENHPDSPYSQPARSPGLNRSQTFVRREFSPSPQFPEPSSTWSTLPSSKEHLLDLSRRAQANAGQQPSAAEWSSQQHIQRPDEASTLAGQQEATIRDHTIAHDVAQPGSRPLDLNNNNNNGFDPVQQAWVEPPHLSAVSEEEPRRHQAAYQALRTDPRATPQGLQMRHPVSSSDISQPRTSTSRPDNSTTHAQRPALLQSDAPPSYESIADAGSLRPSAVESSAPRPSLNPRNPSSSQHSLEDSPMSSSNNGTLPAPKAVRTTSSSNRQSIHDGVSTREPSSISAPGGQPGLTAFNTPAVPTPAGAASAHPNNNISSNNNNSNSNSTHHNGQSLGKGMGQVGEGVGRVTPQPAHAPEDMTEEEVAQLVKDHRELREKYTKVKKYYFEKEDQVKQLQNSLAHQRLSQSRTSLDDSEYSTRFNRLDGLVAQLAFGIRKSWRSVPQWLASSVNKDAVTTGKQEMTAVGRAVISCWLVEEVFDRYFHPDLDPALSIALKSVQSNIRRCAPPTHNAEEEESLTSKVVNWRLATLEGLQDLLRSPQSPQNRVALTDSLKKSLIDALSKYLQDPPMSDLEGGVHMIIELVISIAVHIPMESRDVAIGYFMPGYVISQDQMKLETGIPPLTVSIHDDQAERSSLKSAASDVADMNDPNVAPGAEMPRKRSMLSALTGSGKNKNPPPGKQAGAGASSSSLNRPESAQGNREESIPRVRIAAGVNVQIRGRSVLVKSAVFST